MADKNSKPINQVDIEKILKENNAFLKKVGGQIEQNEFKRDVKRALEILSNNYEKKSDDKNYNVLDDYDAVVRLMKEVDVSEDSDCFKSLISNFMPEEYEKAVEEKKNSQKKEKEVVAEEVEKDEINEVTEQVESEDKIESEAEVEQGEPEVEEQESEKTTTQDDEKKNEAEEIEQEEAETELDQEGIEQEESEEVKQDEEEREESEKNDEDQEETEQESKEQENLDQDNDKDDENGKNKKENSIGKAMRDIATTAKEVSQARRKNGNFDRSMTEEIDYVVKKAQKTLVNGKILGMNGGYLHDALVSGAIGIKALAEMTVYSAGKVTLKLAKGAKQFIGKTFTAAKGTAQKAKEKSDAKRAEIVKRRAEINEQKEKDKKEKADELLNTIGDSATSIYEFMEFTEKRTNEFRKACDENCKKTFLDNLESSVDFRKKAENNLEIKNSYDIENKDTLIYNIKEQYKKIIYDNMYKEIKSNFKGLSDEKIKQFINDSGIKKGQLSISSNGYITTEQLQDSELYETLEKTNKIEKYLNNLDEKDIESLLKLSHRLNSKIETPKEGAISDKSSLVFGLNEISHAKSNEELGINKNTFEFAKMFTELNIPYEMADKEIQNINNSVKHIDVNSDVLNYCYSLDLQNLSTELWFQMVDMRNELDTMKYKDGKTISDELRKKELISIATSKVKALEKKGIFETIQEENGKEIKILAEAEDVLIEAEDIEKIVNNKKSRIYRDTKNTGNNEQTVKDDQEQEP